MAESKNPLTGSLPRLEEACGLCKGAKGHYDAALPEGWGVCGGCGGSGFTPTDAGQAILMLFQHNFTARAEIVRMTA